MYRAGGLSGTFPLANSPAEQAMQAHSPGDKVVRFNLPTGAKDLVRPDEDRGSVYRRGVNRARA